MPSSDGRAAKLTEEAKKSIRNYIISIMVLPGIALTVVAFLLGFFIKDVALEKATANAFSNLTEAFLGIAGNLATEKKFVERLRNDYVSIDNKFKNEKSNIDKLILEIRQNIKKQEDRYKALDALKVGQQIDEAKKAILLTIRDDPTLSEKIFENIGEIEKKIIANEKTSQANAKRLDSIDIHVICHLSGIGDQRKGNGQYCGTRGQSRSMEGISVNLIVPPK